jgi:hypothetical protein
MTSQHQSVFLDETGVHRKTPFGSEATSCGYEQKVRERRVELTQLVAPLAESTGRSPPTLRSLFISMVSELDSICNYPNIPITWPLSSSHQPLVDKIHFQLASELWTRT